MEEDDPQLDAVIQQINDIEKNVADQQKTLKMLVEQRKKLQLEIDASLCFRDLNIIFSNRKESDGGK